MEQSLSCKANWFSTSQEIPSILWDLKVHYHDYSSKTNSRFLNKKF